LRDAEVPAGEIWLLPAAATARDRRDLAVFVLEQGLAGLAQGPGPHTTLVLETELTLDHFLAALFAQRLYAQRLQQGEPLAPRAADFARYAALVREGLRPSLAAPDDSLEGLFLGILSVAGHDLTDPAVAARANEGWDRLAQRVEAAILAGTDPFTATGWSKRPEFARERAYLMRDQEVYWQDLARGERWRVRLPGGPPEAAGLLLRQPKSVLWKSWSRAEPESESGLPTLFLAVAWTTGRWVFSTDPVQRLPLGELAAELQAAEAARAPEAAAKDPWFAGQPFAQTLIAAPRAGTVLSDQEVLRIVRTWTKARPVRSPRLDRQLLALGGILLFVFLMLFLWSNYQEKIFVAISGSQRSPGTHDSDVPRPGAFETVAGPTRDPVTKGPRNTINAAVRKLYLLGAGISAYAQARFTLEQADQDVDLLAPAWQQAFRHEYAQGGQQILLNEKACRAELLAQLEWLRNAVGPEDLAVVCLAGHANLSPDKDFYFLPHDYRPGQPLSVSAVSQEQLLKPLQRIPGTVILILDVCHGGALTFNSLGDLRPTKGRDKQGPLIVLAAATSEQQALERRDWGHGALTLALLEGLSGKHHFAQAAQTALPQPSGPGELTLSDLVHYVENRVAELTRGRQAVVVNHSGNFSYREIRFHLP